MVNDGIGYSFSVSQRTTELVDIYAAWAIFKEKKNCKDLIVTKVKSLTHATCKIVASCWVYEVSYFGIICSCLGFYFYGFILMKSWIVNNELIC